MEPHLEEAERQMLAELLQQCIPGVSSELGNEQLHAVEESLIFLQTKGGVLPEPMSNNPEAKLVINHLAQNLNLSSEQACKVLSSLKSTLTSHGTLLRLIDSDKFQMPPPCQNGDLLMGLLTYDNNQGIPVLIATYSGLTVQVLVKELASQKRSLIRRNVAQVLGVCELDGGLGIVSKAYQQSLAGRLAEEGGPLSLDLVAKYAVDICRGVETLHREGLIIGAIEPESFLLDDQDQTHIIDFSFTRALDKSTPLSTPPYLPPETFQLLSDHPNLDPFDFDFDTDTVSEFDSLNDVLTQQADVWSIGCLLVEMLTGQRPYRGLLPSEIGRRVLEAREKPKIPIRLPQDLEGLLQRCFEFDPSARPSISELLSYFSTMCEKAANTGERRSYAEVLKSPFTPSEKNHETRQDEVVEEHDDKSRRTLEVLIEACNALQEADPEAFLSLVEALGLSRKTEELENGVKQSGEVKGKDQSDSDVDQMELSMKSVELPDLSTDSDTEQEEDNVEEREKGDTNEIGSGRDQELFQKGEREQEKGDISAGKGYTGSINGKGSDTEPEQGDREQEKGDTASEEVETKQEKRDTAMAKGDIGWERGDTVLGVGDIEKGDTEEGDTEQEEGDTESERGDTGSEEADTKQEKGDTGLERGNTILGVGDTESERDETGSEEGDTVYEERGTDVFRTERQPSFSLSLSEEENPEAEGNQDLVSPSRQALRRDHEKAGQGLRLLLGSRELSLDNGFEVSEAVPFEAEQLQEEVKAFLASSGADADVSMLASMLKGVATHSPRTIIGAPMRTPPDTPETPELQRWGGLGCLGEEVARQQEQEEVPRQQEQEEVSSQQEHEEVARQQAQEEVPRQQEHEEMPRQQEQEEVSRQQEKDEVPCQQEQEVPRQQEEEEVPRQQAHEEVLRQQEHEEMPRQQEQEEVPRQQEQEEVPCQQEHYSRPLEELRQTLTHSHKRRSDNHSRSLSLPDLSCSVGSTWGSEVPSIGLGSRVASCPEHLTSAFSLEGLDSPDCQQNGEPFRGSNGLSVHEAGKGTSRGSTEKQTEIEEVEDSDKKGSLLESHSGVFEIHNGEECVASLGLQMQKRSPRILDQLAAWANSFEPSIRTEEDFDRLYETSWCSPRPPAQHDCTSE